MLYAPHSTRRLFPSLASCNLQRPVRKLRIDWLRLSFSWPSKASLRARNSGLASCNAFDRIYFMIKHSKPARACAAFCIHTTYLILLLLHHLTSPACFLAPRNTMLQSYLPDTLICNTNLLLVFMAPPTIMLLLIMMPILLIPTLLFRPCFTTSVAVMSRTLMRVSHALLVNP